MSIMAYPIKKFNELWFLKNALLNVSGCKGDHQCIAYIRFEREFVVCPFMILSVMNVMIMKNIDRMSNEGR